MTPIVLGTIVNFTTKATGGPVEGLVVSLRRWDAPCGESVMSVYSKTTGCLHNLPIVGGGYRIVALPGDARVAADLVADALGHYRTQLMAYPAWAERLNDGYQLTFD